MGWWVEAITAAMVAMRTLLLLLILIWGDIGRIAIDRAVDVHADRSPALLGQLTEQTGGSGQQREAAQQLNRQAEIGQRRTADTSPVQGQPTAQNLIMDPPDRLEQPQVRPAQALLVRNLDQDRRPRVLCLVHRMAQAWHVPPVRTGGAHRVQGERIPASVVCRELT